MSYRNKTYVAFDGDNDMGSYRLMTAWKENKNIDFNFYNAHDINTARDTSTEESIKSQLRERMTNAKQMVLLVGQKTKNLRKFVSWEIELARKKDIPIIVVNLNGKRKWDQELCPSAIGNEVYTMHVSFNAKIIKHALDYFPSAYLLNKEKEKKDQKTGNYSYAESAYEALGL